MASREIAGKDECNIDMLYWLLPMLESILKITKSVFCFESQLESMSTSFLLSLLGLLLHLTTSYVLQKSFLRSVRDQRRRIDLRLLYALNPLVIISCTASPVPSLLHLLIVASNYFALKGWITPLYLCIALLVTGHCAFLSAIPGYLFLLRAVVQERRNKTVTTDHHKRKNLYRSSLVFILVAVLFFILSYPSDKCRLSGNEHVTCLLTEAFNRGLRTASTACDKLFLRPTITFEPTAGVLWYLDAQVFSRLSNYFSLLIFTQPFLFAIPLLFRLSNSRPLHTVRTYVRTFSR